MKIRFQADADLNHIIVLATIRREAAIDFQSAVSAGLDDLDDIGVLALAASQGRILVTHDRRTMPMHFAEFIAARPSPGVLVVPQSLPVASAVNDLLLIWFTTEAEDWVNRICFLPL
jgi:predicted nuclease of predicted toxin-antitoxin system